MSINRPRVIITIAMLYVAVSLTCDPLAYKIIDLGFTPIIGASILFPMLYTFVDVLAELYGEKLARFIVYVHAVCDLFFTYTIIGVIHLTSPDWFQKQGAFETVFDPMSRLYIAGLIGMLSSSIINIYFLTKWKKLYKGKYFWARSFGATAIGILVYTVVTDMIAFANIRENISITIANVSTNILFSAVYSLVAVPIVRYFKFLISDKKDSVSHYNPYEHTKK